ncbi:MAG: hypothetical protein LRS46_01680 [Desulfurococcales archaeon]|nr:hypothetical protein [Desulfurococcales archaeon]
MAEPLPFRLLFSWSTQRLRDCRRVAGIDPAGVRGRWGIAVLERISRSGGWRILWTHEFRLVDLSRVLRVLPEGICVVCIDAPITPSWGKPFRAQERILLRLGGKPLPLNMRSMAILTRTGIVLARMLVEAGYYVVETHPGSLKRILGGHYTRREGVGEHAYDAILAATACAALASNEALILKSREGSIVLALNPQIVNS